MREDKVSTGRNESRVICNEGPPQIATGFMRVAKGGGGLLASPTDPGAYLAAEHITVRPVIASARPGCGRHEFKSGLLEPGGERPESTCGNCRFSVTVEGERRSKGEE